MLRFARLALLLLVTPAALAQPDTALEGTVRYEVRTQRSYGELPPEMEALRTQLEREQVETRVVQFSGAAIRSTTPSETQDAQTSSEGHRVHMSRAGMDLFVDLDRGVRVGLHEFMDRTFRVEEPFEPLPWRLTGEVSTFLGYEVHQATAETPRGTVEAWFAPEVPVPVGPDVYAGLPGLVLLVTESSGQRAYTAQHVDLAPLPAPPAAPTAGRAVTRAEFEQIVEERTEQLRRTRGGNVITIRPN